MRGGNRRRKPRDGTTEESERDEDVGKGETQKERCEETREEEMKRERIAGWDDTRKGGILQQRGEQLW